MALLIPLGSVMVRWCVLFVPVGNGNQRRHRAVTRQLLFCRSKIYVPIRQRCFTVAEGALAILRLINNLERGAIFRPRFAMIVNSRRRNIRVTQPLLDLGDIGLVVERIGGGRRAE